MANNAGLKILPGIREEVKRELSRKVPKGKLIQRIAEGLDAKAIKLAQSKAILLTSVTWSIILSGAATLNSLQK